MEVQSQPKLTPERHHEATARYSERDVREGDADESDPSREESLDDVVARLRSGRQETASVDPATDAARRHVAATEAAGTTVAELIELSKKVQQGDRQAQEQIIRILDNQPHVADLLGDLSQRAEAALIEAVSDDLFAFKLARARSADSMRRELLATCATPLERMAARNVVASWLQVQVIDESFASAAQRGVRLLDWTKMQERAAKRYQNALKSLELASKASQALSCSNSSADVSPSVAAATKAEAGKRTRSKPAKRKPAATQADKSPVDCSEQTHCEMPVRPPTGPIRTTRKPANRVARFVGTNGAPPNSNGHAPRDSQSAVGAMNGK